MNFTVFINGEFDHLPKFVKIYENKVDFEPEKGDQGDYLVSILFETKKNYNGDPFGLTLFGNLVVQ